ncbi:MerT mercuric transport protein [Roseovarius mucosus DSM 17069]|uniref:Mercuric transport protein MerT n=3 Tax=Rhodobacterales TaxID=204455 RepID=A0A5A9YZ26_9RHOB|nr:MULTISPECIES: mercuric transporter MerT family protein [Rhodobacterales]KQI67732.1 mercury transporter [Loktanella sp. 3ANDIMAR09]MBS4011103.1 mercury transporter [Roseovarius sp.]MCD1620995.1 mercury transporter [Salipiger manganoxidans]RAI52217.1 mercury transporter [Rhodobacteraceae bacterium AsT-22]KAA0910211.1 mercury transporter [Aquicoccus porphyridii]
MEQSISDHKSGHVRQVGDDTAKGWGATGFGVLGALAMTSCCILPLVLVSFGVTGVFIAQLGAFYAYKWYTFALSAAFLGYGFYKAYKPVNTDACADGTCARPINRTVMRVTLWAAAAIVAVAMAFPYITPFILKF